MSSEYLWRAKALKGERARKFVHILAGVWMAFWPFYLSFDAIFVLGVLALTLLAYSRLTNLFHAIYAIKRKTYGDLLFACAVVLCAYIGREPWIYTTSILFMAMADGGAALAGKMWGKKNEYLVFGSSQLSKSVAGTAAFIALAYMSVIVGVMLGGREILSDNYTVFALLPFVMAAVENVSPYGLDNLATPLGVTIMLNSLL